MVSLDGLTFPCDVDMSGESGAIFVNCNFTQGEVVIPEMSRQIFEGCHFFPGSDVKLNATFGCSFNGCVFDNGSHIHWDGEIPVLLVFGGQFHGPHFQGRAKMVTYYRHDNNQPMFQLPTCRKFRVIDGLSAVHPWEVNDSLMFPLDVRCFYVNHSQLFDPVSIARLTTMVLKNPLLQVEEIRWGGQEDEMIIFNKARQCSQKNRAYLMTILLSPVMIERIGNDSPLKGVPIELLRMCFSFMV